MLGPPVYFPETPLDDFDMAQDHAPKAWRFENQDSSLVLSQLANAKSHEKSWSMRSMPTHSG